MEKIYFSFLIITDKAGFADTVRGAETHGIVGNYGRGSHFYPLAERVFRHGETDAVIFFFFRVVALISH